MKIIINYTGEGIQPYSIEFELDENKIPKTEVDWKKLALGKSNADSICLIEDFTFSSEPSSSNSITANVVLGKPDRLSNLPPEALEQILTKLSCSELIADRRISRYFAKQISYMPLGIFIQSPGSWRLPDDEIKNVANTLRDPENIKRFLELVDIWLKTLQGIERFLAWIDTFHKHFVAIYNSLAKPRSAEHEALFALITDNAISLDLNELDTTTSAIAQNYSAVAASLNAMQTFLRWKSQRYTLQKLPENWRNTATTCYCNLQDIDLRSVYSPKANLQGVNLQRAKLEKAHFQQANLQGANLLEANLRNALLEGANLQRAKLEEADLQGAYLLKANFQGANLQRAKLEEAHLQGAYLQGAKLQGASLKKTYLVEATFQGADLQGAFLQGAFLGETELQGANLQGSYLQEVNLNGANCQEIDLQGAYLQGAKLQGAKLPGAKLPEVDLQKAMLHEIDLQGAYLQGAKLQGASLKKANLKGANFQDADLQWVDLQGADLEGANLTGVLFDESTNLDGCNLAGADVSNITWPTKLLLVAKKSTLDILQTKINSAKPQDLLLIYNQNNKQNHIFDVPQNPKWDKFLSSLGMQKLSNHREKFNEAICKRVNELLESSDITSDNKEALQNLQRTIHPDAAALTQAPAQSLKF